MTVNVGQREAIFINLNSPSVAVGGTCATETRPSHNLIQTADIALSRRMKNLSAECQGEKFSGRNF